MDRLVVVHVRRTVRHLIFKRQIAALLSVCILFTQLGSGIAHAQVDGPDFESPIIEHEPTSGGLIGGVEIFSATVVDNDELASVRLFYRFIGDTEYTRVNMQQIATSANYSARVFTTSAEQETTGIEYYIRAEDAAGNLVLKGFAFQPLVRLFDSTPVDELALPSAQSSQEGAEAGKKINWLYVAIGVLVVGGIAAASSDGGSSSAPPECETECTVVVTAPSVVQGVW
jgi:hypothetical protein